MSKQITPYELAEIMTGLLIEPDFMGELDSPEKHEGFINDLSRVLHDYTGVSVTAANTAQELVERLCGLLLSPNDGCNDDWQRQHENIMFEIGSVIADYCGGIVNAVHPADFTENYLDNDMSSPLMSVSPNDSLPSINRCVWALYDPDGWEDDLDEGLDVDLGEKRSAKEVDGIRLHLQILIAG